MIFQHGWVVVMVAFLAGCIGDGADEERLFSSVEEGASTSDSADQLLAAESEEAGPLGTLSYGNGYHVVYIPADEVCEPRAYEDDYDHADLYRYDGEMRNYDTSNNLYLHCTLPVDDETWGVYSYDAADITNIRVYGYCGNNVANFTVYLSSRGTQDEYSAFIESANVTYVATEEVRFVDFDDPGLDAGDFAYVVVRLPYVYDGRTSYVTEFEMTYEYYWEI